MQLSYLTLFSLRGTLGFAECRLSNTDFRLVWIAFFSLWEMECLETKKLEKPFGLCIRV
jgi:hypothetical protein